MSIFFSFSTTVVALVNLIGLLLAFWVYSANRKNRANAGFSLMVVTILAWITCYHLAILSATQATSVFWFRLSASSVFIFLIAYYFFIVRWFFEKDNFYRFLGFLVLAYGIVFGGLAAGTNLIVIGSDVAGVVARPIFHPLGGPVFYGFVIAVTLFINWVLIREYYKSSRGRKAKIQYFFVGLFLTAGLNIIFNVVLPIFFQVYQFYEIGNYSVFLLLGFTGYAIVTRKLFGIRVVLAALLVGAISILLLLDLIVFTNVIWMRGVKGFSFLLFLVLGYALVRSIEKEIESREELALAYEKLKELDKAKSEFISIASHQLRTPLTAIKGYVSMILEGTYGRLTKKLEAPVRSVADSNDRLIKLVNNLLNISRIESGKIKMEWENVNVKEVGESVQKELGGKMREKNIAFKMEESSIGDYVIRADREKVRNILMNVIDNAIRYTSEGTITMAIKRAEGDMLRMEIRDTGEGMTKEEITGLFESFTRGKAGQRLWTEGAGLGLYIAKKFTDMHGGRIWAESAGKGKGSAFIVELSRTGINPEW